MRNAASLCLKISCREFTRLFKNSQQQSIDTGPKVAPAFFPVESYSGCQKRGNDGQDRQNENIVNHWRLRRFGGALIGFWDSLITS